MVCLNYEPEKKSRMQYLRFIIDNRRFLGFGFLLSFFFSFGTTPIIALFGGEIRAEYGLSHGHFGVLYSIANVVAAVGIVWFGRMIDQTDLRIYLDVPSIWGAERQSFWKVSGVQEASQKVRRGPGSIKTLWG